MQLKLWKFLFKPDYHVEGLAESHVDFLIKSGDDILVMIQVYVKTINPVVEIYRSEIISFSFCSFLFKV